MFDSNLVVKKSGYCYKTDVLGENKDIFVLCLYNILLMTKNKISNSLCTPVQTRTSGYQSAESYLNSEPDLYLILHNRIYPLHRRFMQQSAYIFRKVQKNEKVVTVEFQIDFQSFSLVLDFLYSSKFCFERNYQISKICQAAKILEIESLEECLTQDFHENFEQYSIFDMYRIASQNKIQDLIQKCQVELVELEYEQININRYDLLEAAKPVFEDIIKQHQKLKANKTIVGLGLEQIKAVIEEYRIHNECQINIEELMKMDHDCCNSDLIVPTGRIIKKARTFSISENKNKSEKKRVLNRSCKLSTCYSDEDRALKNSFDLQNKQNNKIPDQFTNLQRSIHCCSSIQSIDLAENKITSQFDEHTQAQYPPIYNYSLTNSQNLSTSIIITRDDIQNIQHKNITAKIG